MIEKLLAVSTLAMILSSMIGVIDHQNGKQESKLPFTVFVISTLTSFTLSIYILLH